MSDVSQGRTEAETVWIDLRGVSAIGRHGVFERERVDGQPFIVDARLEVSVTPGDDRLANTVDYGAVAQAIVGRIQGKPQQLIETLAGLIADDCMAHSKVCAVEVTVHKPQAPIPVPFSDVSVSVRRKSS